jgi:hypothetical protein
VNRYPLKRRAVLESEVGSAPGAPPPSEAPPAEELAPSSSPPSYRRLAAFLGPLVFTGLMMTMDTPTVNAALARLPNAQEALAAFVVGFSLAMLYEAPHIMMIETGTALATSRQALAMIRRFYIVLAAVVGAVGAAVVFTPLYDALVPGLMGIPAAVAATARPAVAVFLLWPLPIGWRRLHQGALIRRGHARAVGAGATVRIVALLVAVFGLVPLLGGWVASTAIGALAMLISVTAEAAYAHWSATRLLADLPDVDPVAPPLTMRHLWGFYWPLAGTSILSTLGRPVLSAGLAAAAGAQADAALAAWGVAWGLLFLINGATLTLGQVAIAWDSNPSLAWRRRGDRLILGLGVTLAAAVALLIITPLGGWILDNFYEATPPLRASALQTLALLVPVPIIFTANALLRGKLIARRQTRLVQRAGLIDLAVMVAVLALGVAWPLPGPRPAAPTLGALTMLAVYCTDALVLGLGVRRFPRQAGPGD